ncbi:hypothetical protein FDG2_2081 [Candidatus Protofrankia californiensis]|uniref:Uncharacterized protein n=1 Tax=Candidatus Protofrankia californiensis TaxID=1839754 RepID=A0A1C3NWV2_9ACTN|nr:hypothetical protein FDG2_2081 [Candidatus Protofrankia californiensis]
MSIGGLTPAGVPVQSRDVVGAVRTVTVGTPYLVLWANYGSLTDLAAVLADDPRLADRLWGTVAAGPLDDGRGGGAERPHFGSDPGAAAAVVGVLRQPSSEARDPRAARGRMLPPSLITAEPEQFAIGARSTLRRLLAALDAPVWAALLAAHLDRWFAQGHAVSLQYAALTVADALGRGFIDVDRERVLVDGAGRVRLDPNGSEMLVTYSVDHVLFLDWLERQLREAGFSRDADRGGPPV